MQSHLSNRLELYMASINELEDVNFEQKTVTIGPRGGKLGQWQARVTLEFLGGEFVPILADYMGLKEEDYHKLLNRAVDEFKEYDTQLHSFRFWGRKVM